METDKERLKRISARFYGYGKEPLYSDIGWLIKQAQELQKLRRKLEKGEI